MVIIEKHLDNNDILKYVKKLGYIKSKFNYYGSQIKFSIILPCYNSSAYVIDAINSIFSQTYQNWELIIVDDCSKDDTYFIVKEYINNSIYKDRVKIISNIINLGTYMSINIGILHSTGRYIQVIGSDDTFDENKLQYEYDIFRNNRNIIGCVSKYSKKDRIKYAEVTLCFKRKILKQIGFFDSIRFGADSEFIERIYKYYGKKQVYEINKITYYVNIRQNSLLTNKKTGNKRLRYHYVLRYRDWHNNTPNLYIPLKLEVIIDKRLYKRKFNVEDIMLI